MKDIYYNVTVSGTQDHEYLEKKKPVFLSRDLIWHSWKENNACLYDKFYRNPVPLTVC
jgi:hypothetical protein